MGAACSLGSAECRRCIMATESVCRTDSASGPNTRLLDGARAGDAQAVQTAVKEGASVSVQDAHGWSALHYGAASGKLEVCKVLVDHCSDVNTTLPDFSTPLMLAVEEGHLPIAKLLLDNGAAPWCKDEDGFTAQDRCDKSVKAELSKLLAVPVSESYRKVGCGKL
ncbi:unnamed protein product [Polarella glacialis]|uniref:Uncharacterized protein n=1 Tax=Polarella glacialis TaxID=89957 RepID=A0A813DRS1_POLGL|nr:unnamed protein product [Polarella glacialis]